MNQNLKAHSRSRLDFRVNPCRQYLQKYLEGDFLRDLLASMVACVVTLDLNPAGGWTSDEMSTSVGAWAGVSDWDSWDSSAWRGDSGRGSDASPAGMRFLSRKRAA